MHLVVLTQVLDRRDAVLGFFHGWCAAFAGSVDRLTVVAQRVGEHSLPPNVAVVSLGKEAGGGNATMLRRLCTSLLTLRSPDAVLVHMVPRLLLYAAPLLVPRRVPLYLWYTHKAVDRNLRLAVPLCRKVFSASEESFRMASSRSKLVVTGHGIDCSRFQPPGTPRTVDVLSVGRLAPSKGQDELLAALQHFTPRLRAELAGDILLPADVPFRETLQRTAEERLGRSVGFLGAVPWPDMPAVMGRARVMVNASRTGSIDKVVLEAMACGTLPLTCNESFAPLLGPERAREYMFRRGDVADLEAGLRRLLGRTPAQAEAEGRGLRQLVLDKHDLGRLIPRLVAEMEPVR
ncbi:MAG: glycosyltransferase family 4 protein [Planctomycetota bacterium]